MQIQKPKGTYDLPPKEAFQRTFLESIIREVFDAFNYSEIRTPTFEFTRLFKRSIGEETDIVSKEMYSFNDDEFTLKPEMTAPVIRAYVENRMFNISPVQKLYYISNMFRRERPQAGRFREFSQFGAELIGSGLPESDAEMIALADSILKRFGLKNYKLKVNTIGSLEERAVYLAALKDYLMPYLNELTEESKRRLEKNPLRILDTKNPKELELLSASPVLSDFLSSETKSHFDRVMELLISLGIEPSIEPRLVRGFDYYTSTTFEFISDSLGSQNSLIGGGRYDLLAEQLGAKPTPAIGFAAGLERLEMALQAQEISIPQNTRLEVYICQADKSSVTRIMKLLHDMRSAGIKSETDLLGRSLKSQMKEADRLNAKYVIVLGEAELRSNSCELKLMADGSITKIDNLDNLTDYIKEKKR